LPTPTADKCIGCEPTPAMAERFRRKGSSGSFVEAMAAKMYPTPSASGMPCEGTVRLARQRWLDGDCTLEEANAIAGRDVRDKQGKVPAMWPTPNAADHLSNKTETPERWLQRKAIKDAQGINLQFPLRIAAQMWPTPTSRDWKDVTDPRTWDCTEDRDRFDQLGRAVFKDGTAAGGGALNPTWVEWLMGFPLGWTVCDASGTRSSRRSSKSSGEQ
jgi:DNA (cytosine-5)-methyltransferase 1